VSLQVAVPTVWSCGIPKGGSQAKAPTARLDRSGPRCGVLDAHPASWLQCSACSPLGPLRALMGSAGQRIGLDRQQRGLWYSWVRSHHRGCSLSSEGLACALPRDSALGPRTGSAPLVWPKSFCRHEVRPWRCRQRRPHGAGCSRPMSDDTGHGGTARNLLFQRDHDLPRPPRLANPNGHPR
jgi:hypothetical protein